MQRIFWHWHPMDFTCFTYFLYSTPPRLNISCTKKSIGYIGIVWYRTMTFHQCLYRPANRKNAVITDIYCIFMNSNLYRYQCGIIRMDNGIPVWLGILTVPFHHGVTNLGFQISGLSFCRKEARLTASAPNFSRMLSMALSSRSSFS